MKKEKKVVEQEESDVNDKLVDLLLWYQIEDSNHWIRFIEQEIKFREIQKKDLLSNEPWSFSKKKHEEWEKKIEQLDNEIMQKYHEIGEELSIIEKMHNQITDEHEFEGFDDMISFYDLLTMLKCRRQPKEVNLVLLDKEVTYYFDDDNGYILKNNI